jgi:hypothetical protein
MCRAPLLCYVRFLSLRGFTTDLVIALVCYQIAVGRGSRLREEGTENFCFATSERLTKPETSKTRQILILRWVYYILVTGTLVAFGVLFPVSHWRILCHANDPAPAPASTR